MKGWRNKLKIKILLEYENKEHSLSVNHVGLKILTLCLLSVFVIYACMPSPDILPSISGVTACPSCPPCLKGVPLAPPSATAQPCASGVTPTAVATNASGEPIVISSDSPGPA